jgi:hypothetical protein
MSLLIRESLALGKVLSSLLSLGAIERLLPDNFLDKSRHPHTFCDQACSGMMHRHQKLATGTVNTCDRSNVDFDFLAGDLRRAPDTFGFANPGTAKLTGEFQPRLPAILMKVDS